MRRVGGRQVLNFRMPRRFRKTRFHLHMVIIYNCLELNTKIGNTVAFDLESSLSSHNEFLDASDTQFQTVDHDVELDKSNVLIMVNLI